MEIGFPVLDAQQLYRQWQDGKLLDNDERNALRVNPPAEPGAPLFADFLKSATELES
jgi:hypothetical protein